MTPIQSRSSAALHSGLYSDAPSGLRDVTSFAMSARSSTWLIGAPEARRIGARSERSELRDDPATTHQTPLRGNGCPGTLPGMDSRVASVRRALDPSPLSGLVWLNPNPRVPLHFSRPLFRRPFGAGCRHEFPMSAGSSTG